MITREMTLAGSYAAFLIVCAALLAHAATALSREAPPGEGPLPWPLSDAVALRRVMAATLIVLAVFILAVAGARAGFF